MQACTSALQSTATVARHAMRLSPHCMVAFPMRVCCQLVSSPDTSVLPVELLPQTETALPCSWLDKFYAHHSGPGFAMPHEPDIAAFVNEDCCPTPPCACTGVKFDGSDAGEMTGFFCCMRCGRPTRHTPTPLLGGFLCAHST